MTAHIAKLVADVNEKIPNKTFSGLAVLDWESWRPLWVQNYDTNKLYHTKSIELVTKMHPTWSKQQIEAEAQKQFETAARFVCPFLSTKQGDNTFDSVCFLS